MGTFRAKPMLVDAYQWNPFMPPVFPRYAHDIDDRLVRPTTYQEIAHLLGTSGCSLEPPYWDWSVMGILENRLGRYVVCPNDWVVLKWTLTGPSGLAWVCKDAVFAAEYDVATD